MIKKIVYSLRYRYNRYFRSNKCTFVSAIDLMQPVNGVITAFHLTVISRMIDIERVRGGLDSWWDVRLNECNREVDDTEKIKFHNQTKGIVASMDKFGWDYNLSNISVNHKPFYAYNGTHRLAYSLLKNPYQMVPITVDNDGWEWSSKDGIEYFRNKGLAEDELQTLVNRYYKLIEDYKYPYVIIIPANEATRLQAAMEATSGMNFMSAGRYTLKLDTTQTWFSKEDKKFIECHAGAEVVALHFEILHKDIYLRKGVWGSHTIENWLKNNSVHSCIYSPTITKAIEVDIWLNHK